MTYIDVISEFVDITAIGDSQNTLPNLSSLKKHQLVDLCASLSLALPRPSKNKSAFSYVGNSSLSGFPYPCQMLSCRAKNVGTVLGFAAAYSDEVVLFDPFLEIGRAMLSMKGRVPPPLIQEMSFHIRQILVARPLIDRGICVFESPVHENYCSDCFRRAVSLIKSGKDFEGDPGIFVALMDSYAKNSLVTYDGKQGENFVYRASPFGEMTDHDIYRYSNRKIGGTHVRKGGRLSASQLIELGLPQRFAHFSSYDIIGAARAISDGNVRNSIVSSPQMNSLIEYFGSHNFTKSISVDYPLLAQLNLDSILKIRDQEWHHLSDFRNMVEGGIASGLDLTHEIKSSSDNIEKLLAKNARIANRGLLKDALISSAGIAATVLTSGVSGLVAAAVGAVSAGHLARDLIPKLIDRFSEPENIREEKAYYVWRLTKAV